MVDAERCKVGWKGQRDGVKRSRNETPDGTGKLLLLHNSANNGRLHLFKPPRFGLGV
jgi:hypothetical protein